MTSNASTLRWPAARAITVVSAVLLPVGVCAGCAPARPAQNVPAATDVAALLGAARAASGCTPEALGQGVQLSGTSTVLGEEHTVSVLIGAGSYLMEVRGPLSVARCVTGSKAWTRDIGGETRWLHLGERDELVLQSLFISGRWVDDARLSFSPGDAPNRLRFELKDSPLCGSIVLDAATHRPLLVKYGAGSDRDQDSIALNGAVMFNGVTFPGAFVVRSASGGEVRAVFTTAEEAPTFIRSPFQPVFGFSDVTFDTAQPAALELKRAKTGHLLCRPTINGKQFDWFFFDTGAGGTILTPEVIDELKLKKFGHVPVNGIGGKLESSFVRAGTIELGPVTMRDALATELDLSFVANAIGEKVSGIIGYNLLARCIAEVDQKGGTVNLYEAGAYRAGDAAKALTWAELITYERHPCVRATFEDHAGYFKLDTGAAGTSVSIHAPAVVKFNLLEEREVRDARIGGVGGVRNAKAGTLAWFELGGHRTFDVPAMFATESEGAFDDPYTLGNIGGGLMEPFVLILDYQQEHIAFRRR